MSAGSTRQLAAFWGLSVLLGSAWMMGVVWPARGPAVLDLAFQSAILSGLFGVLGRGQFGKVSGMLWVRISMWGAVLILPVMVSAGAGVALSPVAVALVFTMVPVVTVLAESQVDAGFGSDTGAMRLLIPALLGTGGAALLLPFSWPGDPLSGFWLLVAIAVAISTGIALVRLRSLLPGGAMRASASVVCGGWACVCLGMSWIGWRLEGDWVDRAALDLIEMIVLAALVLVTLWLLREWSAARFSARYLSVSLITVLEGAGLVHPAITWTLTGGVVLMAGSIALLLGSDAADCVDAPRV